MRKKAAKTKKVRASHNANPMRKEKQTEPNLVNGYEIKKFDPDTRVPFGLVTRQRKDVPIDNKISVRQFLDGIRSEEFSSEVLPVRKLDKSDPQYESQKKKARAVWLQHADLMVFDVDDGKTLEIDSRFVLARCKSIGGHDGDEMVIIRTPKFKTSIEREQYRRKIQIKYHLKDGQWSDDRPRFVSLDKKIEPNWDCDIDTDVDVPVTQDSPKSATDFNQSLAPEYYQQAKDQLVPLDNTTALSVYSWMRWKLMTHDATVEAMEQCLFKDTGSMTTKAKRLRYYEKWRKQYEKKFPAAIAQFKSVVIPEPRSERGNHRKGWVAVPEGVKYDTIRHALSYHGTLMDEKTMLELWATASKKVGSDTFYKQLKAQAQRWHPYEEFFDVKWSGVNQFGKLEKYIKTTTPGFADAIKKHIIRGINQLFGRDKIWKVNRYCFTLQGATHIGKSELLRRLTLHDVLPSFSSEVNLEQNAIEIYRLMCQIPNLICEEIDTISLKEVRDLKPLISYSGSSIRLPYDRVPTDMSRQATLWASVNPEDFLQSVDDRWIVYGIKSIDFDYDKDIDFPDLWRQAYAEWKSNPLAGELSAIEVKSIAVQAQESVRVTSLEQFISSEFVESKDTKEMDINDVRSVVKDHYGPVSDTQLGRALESVFGNIKARRMINNRKATVYKIKRKDTIPVPTTGNRKRIRK